MDHVWATKAGTDIRGLVLLIIPLKKVSADKIPYAIKPSTKRKKRSLPSSPSFRRKQSAHAGTDILLYNILWAVIVYYFINQIKVVVERLSSFNITNKYILGG